MTDPVPGRDPGVDPWWHHAAVYQVYPRSFRDSNGDGTGDLRGVINGLDYLASLRVDAIWLSPFYPSPQRDSGYDVADPRGVDPIYGTLDDAKELIDEAHARGLRVIVDVVPNHTSSDRPWFQDALASAPGSAARARYHFRDGRGPDGAEPPSNWISWFGGGAWTRVTEADGTPGQWYLHTFDESQPDLNWSNPEVVEDGLETLRFWLDLGADGFRVDVALGLAKDMTYPDLDDPESLVLAMRMDLDDGSEESMQRRRKVANSPVLDRDEVQDIYRGWRSVMDEYDRDAMAVAEAWVPPERAARYVAPDTLHQIFNFDFMAAPWDADRLRSVIRKTIEGLAITHAPATWALSNHDSPRVVSRLGGGDEGRRRARALALVAHALPGAVYVYQGEELGLADVDLPDEVRQDPVFFRTNGEQKGRDAARVPIPWAGTSAPYGFGSNADTWLPMPEGWTRFTVESEEADPTSPLWQYRSMMWLRHELGSLRGDDLLLPEAGAGILVIERGEGFTCVVNCSDRVIEMAVAGTLLVASDASVEVWAGGVKLPPSTGAWLQR
jgi:alpha-glucosidase